MTLHLRGWPAPGWLLCRIGTRHLTGGFHEEGCDIWDCRGALVARSRQLALLHRARGRAPWRGTRPTARRRPAPSRKRVEPVPDGPCGAAGARPETGASEHWAGSARCSVRLFRGPRPGRSAAEREFGADDRPAAVPSDPGRCPGRQPPLAG
nr:hypothetical protein [Actinomadura kijaniata]